MHYRLSLTIRYEFERPSGGGRQLLRVIPADLPGRQELMSLSLKVTPDPAEELRFTDFFGNRVTELVMPSGLTEFEAEMRAEVVRFPRGRPGDLSPPLPLLTPELARIREIGRDSPHHFRAASPRIPLLAEIGDFARSATMGCATVLEMVEALGVALHDRMEFDADATDVDTPIGLAFAQGRGVCQDFAQIMISGLRSLGVPAGYVGGYLRTLPPPGKPRLVGADAMHAWVRAWCGPSLGWIEHDPTNACFADADHIAIGHGRDYGEVAPVTGSLRLDGAQKTGHTVDLVTV